MALPLTLRLLIVEDSPMLQEFYRDLLQDSRLAGQFDGIITGDAKTAIAAVHRRPPDIVILDWILPDKDGMAVLDAVRFDPRARAAQVFVVTGVSAKEKEVEALRLGADDYLRKPFDRDILVARLLNLARRLKLPPSPLESMSLQDLRLEMPLGQLKIGKKTVILHRKEADVLKIFLKRPNMIHSSEYLWDTVWGYPSTDFKNTLHATLSNLRKKLGSRWGRCLENIKDQGYVLVSSKS